jgi:Fe-S cluster biogenesis protein NfuA
MKFVANMKLVPRVFEFKSAEEAKNAPLAIELFNFPFVKEVFFDLNYIASTKNESVSWEDVSMEVREFIREYLSQGGIVLSDEALKAQEQEIPGYAYSEDLDDTSRQIIDILEEYVKPAVASDGGNIVFQSYEAEAKRVHVVLQGACSGCPSSTFTLKNGIQTMLQNMMGDKVTEVVAVNG